MDILPIDFDLSLEEITKWHNQWKVERYGSDSLNPERYYNTTEDGRYLYGVKEGESLNDEKEEIERVLELICRLRLINQQLKGKGLSQHMQYVERVQLKKEREGLYKEYLELIQQPQSLNPEPQRPKELSTPEAKRYFEKAIELGLMDNKYIWLKGLQMLACFAVKMSNVLGLGKGMLSDGRKRVSWKPFETLFEVAKGKLRLNYNDIQKTGQEPKEAYLIDKVFE